MAGRQGLAGAIFGGDLGQRSRADGEMIDISVKYAKLQREPSRSQPPAGIHESDARVASLFLGVPICCPRASLSPDWPAGYEVIVATTLTV